MAYPAYPVISYSFTQYSQSQGDNKFPGAQVDAQLAALRNAIVALNNFTRYVQRADGQLNNGIVDFDKFSPDLQLRFGLLSSEYGTLLEHTHTIANILTLQDALDAKANVDHTQDMSTINGLAAALESGIGTHLHHVKIHNEVPGSAYTRTSTSFGFMSTSFDYVAPTPGAACEVEVVVYGSTQTPIGGGSSLAQLKVQVVEGASWVDVTAAAGGGPKTVGQSNVEVNNGAAVDTDVFFAKFLIKLTPAQQLTGGGFRIAVAGAVTASGTTLNIAQTAVRMAECAPDA